MMSFTPKYFDRKLETLSSIVEFVEGGNAPSYPANVFLEVSNLCDLKCAMCGPFSALNAQRLFSLREQERGFMELSKTRDLDDLLAHTLNVQVFGYGEPTLNPDFTSFLERCGHFETLISFFSNGMHLSPELAEKIVANRVFELNISFSGATKIEYEAIYQGGVWETVLGGIRNLSEAKRAAKSKFPIISINSLGYRHHVDRVVDFVELMADVGVNAISLKPLIPVPTVPQLAHHVAICRSWVEGLAISQAKVRAAELGVELRTGMFEQTRVSSPEQYEEARRNVFASFWTEERIAPVPIDRFKHLNVQALRPGKAKAAGDAPANLEKTEKKRAYEDALPAGQLGADGIYCFEPFYTFYVGKNFQVKPCCNAAFPTDLGDLADNTCSSIWNGPGFETMRKTILNAEYPKLCHDCVRNHNAHANHHFLEALYNYRQWYHGAFGADSDEFDVLIARLKAAGSNGEIVQRQMTGKKVAFENIGQPSRAISS